MADKFEQYLAEELLRSDDPDRTGVAIRVIFVHYRARLSSYALSLLSDRPEWCDDVLMDTILRVYRKREQLLDHPSPVKWVFRMLYFVAMEKRRMEIRPLKESFEDEETLGYSDIRADDGLRSGEVMQAIREAMDGLSQQEYEVFERYYFGHLDKDQIALALGLARQTVSNLLSLARRKVWARLESLEG